MITNKYNLPDPIYRAVNKEYKPNPERFSVTDLIGPPLIRQLKLKHWDELVEDASERLWRLQGQVIDRIISENVNGGIVQEKFEIPCDGVTIVGKPDVFYPDAGSLEDWKYTSVWSALNPQRIKEWEKQLNCYAWFERLKKRIVNKLTARLLLRDWTVGKALSGNNYPPVGFSSKKLNLWSFEEQDQYIKQQLEYHRVSEPEECTPDDKWQSIEVKNLAGEKIKVLTAYAVMKKGRKSALRVLDSRESAQQWCLDNDHAQISETEQGPWGCLAPNIAIIERPGECVRCLNYCPVRTVCPYSPHNKKNNEEFKREWQAEREEMAKMK